MGGCIGMASAIASSVVAVGRNRKLLRLEGAYGLWSSYELAIWVSVLFWAFHVGGAGFAGLVAVLQYVPAALLAPFGGAISDRYAHDVVLRATYAMQAVCTAIMAALIAFSAPRFAIVSIAVITSTLIGWIRPPHYAASAELSTTPADVAAGNSLSGTLERVGYFVGPLVAGFVTNAAGIAVAVSVCAGMVLASCLLLTGMRLGRPKATADAAVADENSQTAEPPESLLRTLMKQPAVLVVLLAVGVEFLVEGCTELLAISFASQHFANEASAAGVLMGAEGVGGIVGAIVTIAIVRIRSLRWVVSGSLGLAGLALLAFIGINTVAPASAALVFVGLGTGFFATAAITLLQRSVADPIVSRILGLRESALLGGQAAGAALAPLLVREFGSSGAYVVLGVTLFVLVLLIFPALIRLDARAVFRPHLLALLRGIHFLGLLDVESIERLAHSAVEVEAKSGSAVIVEDEPGHAYFVVESGELVATVAGQSKTSSIAAGAGFGEIALLRDVPRTATVSAVTDCALWSIERNLFLDVVAGSSGHDLADRYIDQQLRNLAPESLRPPSE